MDFLEQFEKLKISAFSKYQIIGEQVHDVTIGPNSSFKNVNPEENHNDSNSFSKENAPHEADLSNNSKSVPPVIQLLRELEDQRKEEVKEALNNRLKQFSEFSYDQHKQKKKQWQAQQQAFIINYEEQQKNIMQQMQTSTANKYNRNEQLVQHFQRRAKLEQQIEENKEKNRLLREQIEIVKASQLEFRKIYQEIMGLIQSCESIDIIKNGLGGKFSFLKSLPKIMEEVVNKAIARQLQEDDMRKNQAVISQVKAFKVAVEEIVTAHKKKIEEEKVITINYLEFVHPINLKNYEETMTFHQCFTDNLKPLLEDDNFKRFRFDCKKAINIPVNAISAANIHHLKDKYSKLFNLLTGKSVTIGDITINASNHPLGISFCKDLLAKQLVLQGDLAVSSNPEAAFCYATIIVTLWNDFPDFGKLLLAYFYKQCPYLVPYYIPKTDDLTPEEHYQKLGYKYLDGKIEKQDKFLKRITGIMRLYFAILVATPKQNSGPNPHNLKNAYRWLASILNLEPRLDITATALHTFLETVGFKMDATYGRVFKKIIRILRETYLSRIKQIESGGPVSRLEGLLQVYCKEGTFKKPSGLLPENFW